MNDDGCRDNGHQQLSLFRKIMLLCPKKEMNFDFILWPAGVSCQKIKSYIIHNLWLCITGASPDGSIGWPWPYRRLSERIDVPRANQKHGHPQLFAAFGQEIDDIRIRPVGGLKQR